MSEAANVVEESVRLFDAGYYCAESVLMAVAGAHGIQSPLIPAIATGLCGGMSRTSGMCGALSGGILALNLMHGRSLPAQSVGPSYAAVQQMIAAFSARCGASGCTELLGCDLGSEVGRDAFRNQGLSSRCREYVGIAADIATGLAQGEQVGQLNSR